MKYLPQRFARVSVFTRTALIIIALLSATTSPALADANEGLYGPTPPPDSAFVRLLNVQQTPESFSIRGYDRSHMVGAAQVSPYLFLPAGNYQITTGSGRAELAIALVADQAVTLVFMGDKLIAMEDQLPTNAQRALVGFYNFSARDSALKTADGRFDLVSSLKPLSVGFREINEVRMAFAAFDESGPQVEFEPLLLRKGRSYSFIVINDQDNNLRNVAVANVVDSPL